MLSVRMNIAGVGQFCGCDHTHPAGAVMCYICDLPLAAIVQAPEQAPTGEAEPTAPLAPVLRACSWSGCGKVLHAAAGFIEVTHQLTGDLESYCSLECLHWQLHEELR